jgi:hypothetical protein
MSCNGCERSFSALVWSLITAREILHRLLPVQDDVFI